MDLHWAESNDPDKVVAHEAMREIYQGISPYSTGDALKGGWAATNLAIYGSSSVGYLGAIVKPTNVDKIIQMNLNATDFYSDDSYPSYLYYNPYDTPQAVLLDVGPGTYDLYETLREEFIHLEVTGQVSIILPPKEAALVVITPPAGEVTYDKNTMLIDNVVVDYMQTQKAFENAPRIKALEAEEIQVEINKNTSIYCTAEDVESETLIYQWQSTTGVIEGNQDVVNWTAPHSTGVSTISVKVTDADGNSDSTSIDLNVVEEIPHPPIIQSLTASNYLLEEGEIISITCDATDENSDSLSYHWSVTDGTLIGTGPIIQWQAPLDEGTYNILVEVSDPSGLTDAGTISVLVKTFSGEGNMIAWYPLNGNALDQSGNALHGTIKGAIPTVGHLGEQNTAYYFNGGSQHIEVDNQPILNFQDAISVSLWFKSPLLEDHEQFLISHGSWQNRWKLSITPSGNLRWTINTTTKIADLDNDFILEPDRFYHIVATYDGASLLLYIDGEINAFSTLTGKIKTVDIPLLIGQMLPGIPDYNFKGVIDDILIFDYALNPNDIQDLYLGNITSSKQPGTTNILSIYPNPGHEYLYVDLNDVNALHENVTLTVTNTSGLIQKTRTTNTNMIYKMDISSLQAGLYFLHVKGLNANGIQGIKFIKS